jgi:hypothetical protein
MRRRITPSADPYALSYNPTAEKDMMQTALSAIKTKKFVKGIDSR